MKAADIALLVIAIALVPIGGVLACVDSALARVSVARVDELVREDRRGAKALRWSWPTGPATPTCCCCCG